MAFEHKENRGSMFVNDDKQSESQPDRKGDGKVTCPDCGASFGVWLSGWINKRDGKPPFLSLAFKPKDKPLGASKPASDADYDDDIPF